MPIMLRAHEKAEPIVGRARQFFCIDGLNAASSASR
jgi:hypothetical protein